MDNKYYIPEISDLRVGYKCKITVPHLKSVGEIEVTSDNFGILSEKLKREELVTNYLTKEDIEAEGWVFQYEYRDGMEFEWNPETIWKDTPGGFLDFYPETHIIRISTTDGEYTADGPAISTKYKGYCPSVNELRTILKLLKIR